MVVASSGIRAYLRSCYPKFKNIKILQFCAVLSSAGYRGLHVICFHCTKTFLLQV